MGRATAVAVVALLALAAAPAQAAGADHTEPAPVLTLKPAIPPELAALEAKADALQVTSVRVSLRTSLRIGKVPKGLREFLRLFELKVEGVETTSPPAAALQVTLLGSHVRMRFAEGHVFLFSWELGLRDGGRPWIELGHGPLGRLFKGVGKAKVETDPSGAARYGKLFTLVNGGTGIHELAPTALYGQAVTGFQEQIEPQAASAGGETGGALGGFSAARRRPAPVPKPAPKPTATLSIFFAASGAPVRVQIETGTAKAGSTVTADFPAIDFPYTIPAPPPSHVIGEAALRKHVRPRRRTRTVIVRGAARLATARSSA